MKIDLNTHSTPVSKQASKVFWKTPWWAIAPSEVKKAVIEERLPPEIIDIDYFKPPPNDCLKDWRGTRLVGNRIIVGYAGCKERRVIKKAKKRTRIEKTHWWWVFKNNEFFTIQGRRLKKASEAYKAHTEIST